MGEATLVLVACYLLLTGVRIGLAARTLRETSPLAPPLPALAATAGPPAPAAGSATEPPPVRPPDEVTVLVAVRSGDPLLGQVLAEQAATLGGARVLLLVDDDDAAGVDAATTARSGAPGTVEIRRCPPPPPGLNPKTFKLAAHAPKVTGLVAVLDDDTILPPGALARAARELEHADLVTGVPVYREQGGLWSRLVAAFVNGSSLLTYLPAARVSDPMSVNGMFVLTRSDTLARVGGFASLTDQVCDDYALARAYRRAGLRIAQTAIVHPLSTTVAGPVVYARLMRRWMLFAMQVLRRDPTPAVLLLVALPTVLPVAALASAVTAGWPMPTVPVAAVAVKALGTRWLRRQAPPAPTGATGVGLEVLADLLLPVHLLTAALGPRTVVWRGRRVVVRAPR